MFGFLQQISNVDQLAMNAESMRQISSLYSMLDKNGDGVLSSEDWASGSEKWKMLQSRFDINGDNKITYDEFQRRLRLMAFESPIEPGAFPAAPTSYADALEKLTASANATVQNLCKELYNAVANELGPPPAKSQKTNQVHQSAAPLHVELLVYQYRGGAPPYRGFHRQGPVEVLTIDPNMQLKDVASNLVRKGQNEILVAKKDVDQIPSLPFNIAPGLKELPLEGDAQSCLADGDTLLALVPMRGGFDIGVFEPVVHADAPFLGGESFAATTLLATDKLISAASADPEAAFKVIPPFVPARARRALMDYLDHAHATKPEEDLKQTLSQSELAVLIGAELVQSLVEQFGGCDKVRLRRCAAVGKRINLHTDVHRRTMQVPLNGDSEYEGGKLVYITKDGLQWPARQAGSATIHDSTILHGVTELKSGVRYSLFLQEE